VKNTGDRIAEMEMQLKALRERHSKAESKRKRDMVVKMKKDDLRRRLLAGSVVIDRVQRGELAEAEFKKWRRCGHRKQRPPAPCGTAYAGFHPALTPSSPSILQSRRIGNM
jgi:hypothetical protein